MLSKHSSSNVVLAVAYLILYDKERSSTSFLIVKAKLTPTHGHTIPRVELCAATAKHIVVCFFGVYRPTREFFTHMETSPLPVKGCKFLPMLGTHGN